MSDGPGRRQFGGMVAAGLGNLALVGALAGVTGCAATLSEAGQVVSAILPTTEEAIRFYGVAKGIAEMAVVAEPALAPVVAALVAMADPLMLRLQTETLAADAAANGALQLAAQARALLLQTAAVVHVLPNTAA